MNILQVRLERGVRRAYDDFVARIELDKASVDKAGNNIAARAKASRDLHDARAPLKTPVVMKELSVARPRRIYDHTSLALSS